MNHSHSQIILTPHITEKSAVRAEDSKHPVYTFRIAKTANKDQVARAVKTLFKVDAVKVTVVNIPAKAVMSRNKPGVKSGYKKAMVFLKAGDKIAFA